MPLTKVKKGSNMYAWVTHTQSFLRGRCPHLCSYCYVQAMGKRFPAIRSRYSGKIGLVDKEVEVKYAPGATVFIEHQNDLWADEIPGDLISAVLNHVSKFPETTFVFQTKNPRRYVDYLFRIPEGSILGATIETNYWMRPVMGEAPSPQARYEAMMALRYSDAVRERRFKFFVTVEPILQGAPSVLAKWISKIDPEFINIGADSKGTGLPEPTKEQVEILLGLLREYGIEIREKHNLQRLLK